jgi:hypothetical protein
MLLLPNILHDCCNGFHPNIVVVENLPVLLAFGGFPNYNPLGYHGFDKN